MDQVEIRWKQKMDQSLGHKIDKRCGPQFVPDKKYAEEGTFEGSEKGAGQHCH
jgi:hypothetical protein